MLKYTTCSLTYLNKLLVLILIPPFYRQFPHFAFHLIHKTIRIEMLTTSSCSRLTTNTIGQTLGLKWRAGMVGDTGIGNFSIMPSLLVKSCNIIYKFQRQPWLLLNDNAEVLINRLWLTRINVRYSTSLFCVDSRLHYTLIKNKFEWSMHVLNIVIKHNGVKRFMSHSVYSFTWLNTHVHANTPNAS